MMVKMPPINLYNVSRAWALLCHALGSGKASSDRYGCFNRKFGGECQWPKQEKGAGDRRCRGCEHLPPVAMTKGDYSVSESWARRWGIDSKCGGEK